MDEFKEWLNRELNTRGWSFREAGRRSGLSGTTISDVVAGKTNPGLDFYVKIARAFGEPPANVLRLREVMESPSELSHQHDVGEEEAEQISQRVTAIERAVLDNRERINRLANLYSVGRTTLELVIEQQRQLEVEIARLDDERLALLAQLDDAVARQAHARDVERLVIEIANWLDVAGADFAKMRWIVEMLDVTARLETNGKSKLAHMDVGGRFFATVPIVPNNDNHNGPNA